MSRRFGRGAYGTLLTIVTISLGAAHRLPAQSPAPSASVTVVPEVRADVIGGRRTSVQLAAGAQIPIGPYVRLGAIAGIGAPVTSGSSGASGRLDVLARFLIDPFRQSSWGLSAGGGVSLRAEARDRIRPNLLLVLDLEGPRWRRGFSPALQVGFGGGARIGVGLRWNGRAAR
ncbi:MAG: hypothetical protein ABIP93_15910 [Gemmatimonadaceae bacterium]